MLASTRKNEIRNKVDAIITASDKYHFIHATYACQLMIKNMVSAYYQGKCRELSEKIRANTQSGADISDDLLEEYQHLFIMTKEGRAHIDIDFIDTSSEDEARVVKTSNAFVINLPLSLANRVTFEDGSFDKDVVEKIRKLVAHELGHIILHTDELLKIEGTQGSKELSGENKEAEADFFADEIIQKRNQRNELLHTL